MILTAQIQHYGEAGYIGSIDSIKGLVVQGSSREEVRNELLISLRVKLAYNLGIDISKIENRAISPDIDEISLPSNKNGEETENEEFELCLDIK